MENQLMEMDTLQQDEVHNLNKRRRSQKVSFAKEPCFVVAAGICWGIIGVFSKPLAFMGLKAIQITFLRAIVVAFTLGIYLFFFDRKKLRIHRKDIWMFLGTGIVSIVFFNICYFSAMQKTSLAVAAILLYTAPFLVIFLSAIFFHEKVTHRKLIAVLLAFFGCVLTTGLLTSSFDARTFSVLGILYGLGSGLGYAMYSIFGNIALKKYHPFTVTFYTFLIATIALAPFAHMQQITYIGLHKSGTFVLILCLGEISTLLPFLLYTKGLKGMDAGKASILAFVEPMIASVISVFWFKEAIKIDGMIGIICIFLAVILLNTKANKR